MPVPAARVGCGPEGATRKINGARSTRARAVARREERGHTRGERARRSVTSKVSGVTGPMSIYILTMPTVLTHWDVVGGRARASCQDKQSQDTFSPPVGQAQARAVPHRRSSRRTQRRGRPQDLPQTRPRTVQPADPRSQRYESCRRGGLPIMYAAFRLGMLWSRRPRWPDQP